MIIIIVLGLVMLLPDQDQTKALTRQVTAGSKRSGCSLSGGFSDLIHQKKMGFRNLQEKLKVFFPLCRVLPSTPSSKFSFWRNTKRQKRESGVGLSIHWSLFIRDSLRFEFHIWLSNFYYRHLPNFCQLFRYFIVKISILLRFIFDQFC